MCISVRDDSLSWPMHAPLYVCSRLKYTGGVLGISSDGDDRGVFLGLKFSIPGFLGVQNFGKYFFG